MIEILNGTHETVRYTVQNVVRVYHNVQTESYPLHWHTAIEIIMPFHNIYTVGINGQSITFREGDIFIIPPGTLHTLEAPAEGDRLIIQLDYAPFCHLNGMDSLLHVLHPYKLIDKQENYALSENLTQCLLQVQAEYFESSPYAEASIYSTLIRFFVLLGRSSMDADSRFPNITAPKQHEYIEKFLSVCSYINEHCTENLTIEELAARAGFSKFHFSRLFKQFTGYTYHAYLINKRVAYAEKLLIVPDLSITDVAMQSGFNSLSTFNRIFKEVKNCTPSEYKQLNKSHPRN